MWRLVLALALKEFKQRYHERHLRTSWLVINPLFHMLILTLVFSKITRFASEGSPYPLFSLSALVPWIFFASCLRSSCYCLTTNRALITRLKFPRVALPISVVLTHLADLAVSLALFLAALCFYKTGIDWSALVYLWPVWAIQLLLSTGIGLGLSIANAYARDTENILPIVTQAWLLASPVAYSVDAVPESWRTLYLLNPVAVIIDGYRQVLLHGRAPDTGELWIGAAVSGLIFVCGWFLFRILERDLADVI